MKHVRSEPQATQYAAKKCLAFWIVDSSISLRGNRAARVIVSQIDDSTTRQANCYFRVFAFVREFLQTAVDDRHVHFEASPIGALPKLAFVGDFKAFEPRLDGTEKFADFDMCLGTGELCLYVFLDAKAGRRRPGGLVHMTQKCEC